mmetsp:Transcript_34183/g.68049  ORF Transcript_34183/g.68049 Transcript_34183/m.68049 type:complete len:227 (+) Transcript_34183:192-872(+)
MCDCPTHLGWSAISAAAPHHRHATLHIMSPIRRPPPSPPPAAALTLRCKSSIPPSHTTLTSTTYTGMDGGRQPGCSTPMSLLAAPWLAPAARVGRGVAVRMYMPWCSPRHTLPLAQQNRHLHKPESDGARKRRCSSKLTKQRSRGRSTCAATRASCSRSSALGPSRSHGARPRSCDPCAAPCWLSCTGYLSSGGPPPAAPPNSYASLACRCSTRPACASGRGSRWA